MIVHVRSAKIIHGKEQDVLAFAKELNEYLGSKNLEQYDVLRPQFGAEVDRIAFVWNFETLGEYEEWDLAVHADEGVVERLKAIPALFAAGSLTVQSYRQLEL